VSFCLIIVGIINFVPVVGAISTNNLENAYSISLASNDLIILMRHRALLFGVLGSFILYSVFVKPFQGAAMLMAAVSMLGYVALVYLVGGYNASILNVLFIDVIGLAVLFVGIVLKYFGKDKVN
jgi:hypothetical protein